MCVCTQRVYHHEGKKSGGIIPTTQDSESVFFVKDLNFGLKCKSILNKNNRNPRSEVILQDHFSALNKLLSPTAKRNLLQSIYSTIQMKRCQLLLRNHKLSEEWSQRKFLIYRKNEKRGSEKKQANEICC